MGVGAIMQPPGVVIPQVRQWAGCMRFTKIYDTCETNETPFTVNA
ncbi:hypothetical protein ACVW2L_000002 [Mucilaginibacter sp. HD30]